MGETVTSYSRTRTASKRIFLIIFCIGFLILCGITVGCFVGFFQAKHRQQMIVDGKTATAEIYRCYQDSGFGPNAWRCVYRYVDENGIEYAESLATSYKTSEEGEKHIGEKIEIYIDGKGNSLPVGEESGVTTAIIWITVMTVLLCADTVGIVITSMLIRKEKKRT